MSELFDRAFFSRLGRLKLAMHMRLDQGQTGGRKSSQKGSSVEFSDFREYMPGDDIRRIDWNVYGRLDKLYIKQFMEEKEAFYHVFVDTSASMDYGEKKKSVMAFQLAAVFAWLVQKQLDRVEVISLSDGRLEKMSPVTGKSSFERLLHDLENLQCKGYTQLAEGIRRANIHGKGICILISDFLDPTGIDEAIRYLTFKRQDVLLVHVLAREEIEVEAEGTLALTDMESGQEIQVTMTRQAVESYQDALQRHIVSLQILAKRYGCSYVSVVSDEDLDKVVFETLKQKGIFG